MLSPTPLVSSAALPQVTHCVYSPGATLLRLLNVILSHILHREMRIVVRLHVLLPYSACAHIVWEDNEKKGQVVINTLEWRLN